MILQHVSEISRITLSALQSLLTFRVGELNALTDGREVDSLILILQLKLEHRVNVPAMHQWTAQAAGGAGGSAERHARCPEQIHISHWEIVQIGMHLPPPFEAGW